MSDTIWVTGAGGLIGSEVVRSGAQVAPRFRIVPITRDVLELTDFSAVERRFVQDRPAMVFHCAAMSRSPACEADPALARLHNVDVTRHLSALSAGIPFVFLSTDQVFDGQKGMYVESDPVHPLNVYAGTKVESEGDVLRDPRHLVVRTSLNGGVSPTRDRGFNEQMCAQWRQGRALNLFEDEFRSPIAAAVTGRALWELALGGRSGLYHIAGSERLSRWQMGVLTAERWPSLSPGIVRGSLRDFKGAPRAPDTSLCCDKAQACLGFPLPGFTAWLASQPEGSF